jgi:beta-galactosidase
MVNLFDWHLKEQEQMPNLTGAAQWIFKDFSTPLRPENPVPYVNQKGVLERDGTPKESYYVYQSYWAEKPMIHIYGHSWPIRWGGVNETKEVKVYSNCKEVELWVNGESAGIKQRDVTQYPAAGLSWQVRFKPGENTLRALSGELMNEITFIYQTETWGEPATLELKEISRAGDVVTLETRVFDAKGVPCLDADQLVSFGFTGDGKLLDNLGTASGSRKVQLANGRAKIRAKLTGSAAASVAAEGLDTVILPIKISR